MKLDPSSLPLALQSTMDRELQPLRSLEQVVRWAFSRTPPCAVADVVVQDEFTHDVVIPWGGVHLVFDTT
jgi:membrane carboxypeptidase/penicillin-binding protein PbpC